MGRPGRWKDSTPPWIGTKMFEKINNYNISDFECLFGKIFRHRFARAQ